MKKRIVLVFLFFMLFIPFYKVEAKTLQDLYNELSELEKKYNEAQSSKKLTQSEMNKLNSELTKVNNNITATKGEIVQAEKDIKESEKSIEEKKEESNEFLKFLQISSGENAYLEYLFDAEDYTDLIYRYAIVTQMSEYNNNLISELETLITDLESKKVVLADKQKKLEQQRVEFNSKLNVLRANLNKATEEGTTIEEDITDLKKQINYYKNTLKCSINQDLTTCANIAYATGWRYPMAYGCVTSEYTGDEERTDWVGGGGHYGIDLSCIPEGSPVYSAAVGTVARVVYHGGCGGNMVYIYHNVNGKAYTTAYLHLKSYTVTVGQQVTTDTVIGYMGGGPSTWYYDACTTGAHLHFGIANGHNAYGFNTYSLNPRNIFSFPYGWSYFYRK